jgi:methylated-DNA-[protein]-cysteine S-methyltransferase
LKKSSDLLWRGKRISAQLFQKNVKTPIGTVAVIWSDGSGPPKIVEILIPKPESETKNPVGAVFPKIRSQSCACRSCAEIDGLADRVRASLAGQMIQFSADDLDMLRLDTCAPFQRQVLRAVFAIPRGRVSSYSRIAASVNRPGAARAVGTAMATNPFPLVIPCHRVIQSSGHIGEFGSGRPMKKTLLEIEGVPFQTESRVAKAAFWG